MKTIYVLGGLGADERVIVNLGIPGYTRKFIPWLTPLVNETIANHAKRLGAQISDPNPILIGISFGGMLAVEIAKFRSVQLVILISSAKTKFEIPLYFRLAGKLGLHRVLPYKLLKQPNAIAYWLFSVESENERKLLGQILRDTDPKYLRWAIGQIVQWTSTVVPHKVYHIHGSGDRLLPARFVKAQELLADGGHLMILNRHSEINALILQYLSYIKTN